MCLFGEEEDFRIINSLYFFNIESLKTHFLLFLKRQKSENFFSKIINKKSDSNTTVYAV